jgi:KTSC domain
VKLTSISSTNLNAIGYDPQTSELQIQFHNGDVYSYRNVPQDAYDRMISGDAGRVFASEIKPQRYAMPFTKLGTMQLIQTSSAPQEPENL